MKFQGRIKIIRVYMLAATVMFLAQSCKHEVPDPNMPGGDNNNGTINDPPTGVPCDPNIVYFEQQILPFLVSSCAKSGCHDAASAQNGVILNSYQNVMITGDVTPYNLNNSDIWEVITETDPDKVMPPPGQTPLTQDQINLIGQWINQGAQNLVCDDQLGPCDSINVSFTATIQPILQNKCVGCHTSATSLNGMVNLSNHQGVAAVAVSGRLLGAINHSPGFAPMPNGGPKLNACEIAKITSWVASGSPNN